jgi:hypothetical protein
LLVLNEDMIRQLTVERREGTGTDAFLAALITQHEKAAALLRGEMTGRSPAKQR